jgi:hypothetical protein
MCSLQTYCSVHEGSFQFIDCERRDSAPQRFDGKRHGEPREPVSVEIQYGHHVLMLEISLDVNLSPHPIHGDSTCADASFQRDDLVRRSVFRPKHLSLSTASQRYGVQPVSGSVFGHRVTPVSALAFLHILS